MTSFATESRDEAVVIRPAGRLDVIAAPQLRSVVADAVAAGAARIVIDLVEVTVLDSSGLGALIGAMRTARQAGGDLRIARPNDQALMVLELTTMDRVLRPHSTIESALDGG